MNEDGLWFQSAFLFSLGVEENVETKELEINFEDIW